MMLMLHLLFSWLPPGLHICVTFVIAAFFFIVFVKLISYVLDFVFDFLEFIKPW